MHEQFGVTRGTTQKSPDSRGKALPDLPDPGDVARFAAGAGTRTVEPSEQAHPPLEDERALHLARLARQGYVSSAGGMCDAGEGSKGFAAKHELGVVFFIVT